MLVVLCCVAFPPRGSLLNTHLEGITGAFMGRSLSGCYIRLLQSKAKAGDDSVFLRSSVTTSLPPSLIYFHPPLSFPLIWICLCKHCLLSSFLSRHEKILPKNLYFSLNHVALKETFHVWYTQTKFSGVRVWSCIVINFFWHAHFPPTGLIFFYFT